MADEKQRAHAIQVVMDGQVSRQPANVAVRAELKEMFGGTLYIVHWESTTEKRDFDNFVFFRGDEVHLFYNVLDLTRFLNQSTRRNFFLDLVRDLYSVGGVTSLLALLITVTICYMVAFGKTTAVPDVLSNALSIILGFYFGSKVQHESSSGKRATGKR